MVATSPHHNLNHISDNESSIQGLSSFIQAWSSCCGHECEKQPGARREPIRLESNTAKHCAWRKAMLFHLNMYEWAAQNWGFLWIWLHNVWCAVQKVYFKLSKWTVYLKTFQSCLRCQCSHIKHSINANCSPTALKDCLVISIVCLAFKTQLDTADLPGPNNSHKGLRYVPKAKCQTATKVFLFGRGQILFLQQREFPRLK